MFGLIYEFTTTATTARQPADRCLLLYSILNYGRCMIGSKLAPKQIMLVNAHLHLQRNFHPQADECKSSLLVSNSVQLNSNVQ